MQEVRTLFQDTLSNVALDEALVEYADQRDPGAMLRFWEAASYAVVLGRGCTVAQDVHVDACARQGVDILRRASGGGTVLQGPGCLNYALVLPFEQDLALTTVSGSNRYIMDKMCTAFAPVLPGVQVQGITDLTWEGRKFSGNAQRRKRRYLLFHGTVLYDFDLSRVERVLKLPPRRPEYRADRSHTAFIRNVPLTRPQIETLISEAWMILKFPVPPDLGAFLNPILDRYATGGEWRGEVY